MKCRTCKAELQPHTEMKSTRTHTLNALATEVAGVEVYDTNTADELLHTGHFGELGDDLFCDMLCGYRYAVRRARRRKKG